MAFGQQSGPPATHSQMRELLELIGTAGHADLRDARGPLGLTQRQAGGKFTRDEAEALIALLQEQAENPPAAPGPTDPPAERTRSQVAGQRGREPVSPQPKRAASSPARQAQQAQQARRLQSIPSEALAAELQRRGWAVIEP